VILGRREKFFAHQEALTRLAAEKRILKLPGHRLGLPGNVILLYCPALDPAYKAGLAGYFPAIKEEFLEMVKVGG
jgi:hypothetical protein